MGISERAGLVCFDGIAVQDRIDRVVELLAGEGFIQAGIRAHFLRAGKIGVDGVAAASRNGDDFYVRMTPPGVADGLQAVADGHDKVGDEDVGAFVGADIDGADAVFRFEDGMPLKLEEFPEGSAQQFFVIDYKHTCHGIHISWPDAAGRLVPGLIAGNAPIGSWRVDVKRCWRDCVRSKVIYRDLGVDGGERVGFSPLPVARQGPGEDHQGQDI